jgi:hypothetical protein
MRDVDRPALKVAQLASEFCRHFCDDKFCVERSNLYTADGTAHDAEEEPIAFQG